MGEDDADSDVEDDSEGEVRRGNSNEGGVADSDTAIADGDDAEPTGGASDLLRRVEKEIKNCINDVDEEDAPDWEFADGEKKSENPPLHVLSSTTSIRHTPPLH